MKDKKYMDMLEKLPDFDTLIITRPRMDRSLDPNELKFLENSIVIEDVDKAYNYAKSISGPDDLILICGSCYLAGEFLARRSNIPMHSIMFVQ